MGIGWHRGAQAGKSGQFTERIESGNATRKRRRRRKRSRKEEVAVESGSLGEMIEWSKWTKLAHRKEESSR